ncbi:uncharacterized protein LOC113147205 [Cyclospora cayetanensis]|uniref:Uncharacterized protein LOC113147205 n=1 Tax=Cyclospora cayetanensis TaxID=88456 RepID=A0A6P6RXZ2_9EIME|nr:uncharacterized protein LOC113147205 [Cyclospora cayetanensis]
MRLLGFVPRGLISPELNVAAPVFVTAASHILAEAARRRQLRLRQQQAEAADGGGGSHRGGGSTAKATETRDARAYYREADRVTSSLIIAMDSQDVAAVVALVPRKGAPFMLGALLPQRSRNDGEGNAGAQTKHAPRGDPEV